MQIVIDIPEEIYKKIKETNMVISGRRNGKLISSILFNAVDDGTPLPKGHGRLIDGDELESRMKIGYCIVKNAPTIIEADKAKSEKHTCSECIIKDTDACSRGNTEADDEACEDFVGGESNV